MVTLKYPCSTSRGATLREADCSISRRSEAFQGSANSNFEETLSVAIKRAFRNGTLLRVSVVFAVFLLMGLWSANAQSTFGSIRGTIADAGAAAIPSAKVI